MMCRGRGAGAIAFHEVSLPSAYGSLLGVVDGVKESAGVKRTRLWANPRPMRLASLPERGSVLACGIMHNPCICQPNRSLQSALFVRAPWAATGWGLSGKIKTSGVVAPQ